MNKVPRSFRILWLLLTIMAILGSLSLLSHQSVNPDFAERYSSRYMAVLAVTFLLTIAVLLGNNSKVLGQIYAWRYEGLLFGLFSLIAFGIGETASRLIDPLGISYYEEERRYTREKVADHQLIFRHRPSWNTKYQGVEVRFNELGLRDEPIGIKEAIEYRIVVLGDSVTFGWGVEQHETFSARLQEVLQAQLRRPVRVINSGVGGYNTVQEHLFLKSQEATLSPDMVILVYTAENDTEPYEPQSTDPLRTIEGTLLWNSWLYRLVSHAYYYGWLGNGNPDVAVGQPSSGWRASIEAMRGLRELTEKRKIPLVPFYFRWQPTPLNTALLKDLQHAVEPVSVVDMGDWFADKPISEYVNSKVDSHPNSMAHKLIAEKMATYVLQRSFGHSGTL